MGLLDFKTDAPVESTSGGEADLQTAYQAWKANPGQESNAAMLQAMNPMIDRAARAQTGKVNDLTRGRARGIALQSLASYDPAKGKLTSHIYNHMQGLKRYVGQTSAGIRVPERVMLDRKRMDDTNAELTAELGREPNDDELTDRSGLNAARLKHIRTAGNAMASGFFSSLEDSGGSPFDPAVAQHSDPWNRAIYDDLGPLDKKVFEWSLGFNGHKTIQSQEIARRLRRSPGWVSQRKLLIQKTMDAAQGLNPF